MTREQWIQSALIAPYLVFLSIRTGHYIWLALTKRRLPFDQDMAEKGSTALIGFHLRQIFVWSTDPVFRLLSRWRVSPNLLTLICLVMSVAAGVLIAFGEVALGGTVGLVGSSFDYFDGRVARQTDRTSRAGNFLDSTLDRCCDIAFLGGAAVLFRNDVTFLVAAIVGSGSSLVISYTRAKSEALGGDLKIGVMQRPERVVLFCLGAMLDPWLAPWLSSERFDHAVFAGAVILLAVFASATAIQRTVFGLRELQELDRTAP